MNSFVKLALTLTIASVSQMASASGAGSPDFLTTVSGHYELVDAKGTCHRVAPSIDVNYAAQIAKLELSYAAGQQKAYEDDYLGVNQEPIRYANAWFDYTDEKSVAGGGTVKKQNRNCGGVIIVTCGSWTTTDVVDFKNDTLTVLKSGDYQTDCVYRKTAAVD